MADTEIDLDLAERLDELIVNHHKTAEQIAEDLGVSPAGLHKWRRKGQVKRSKLAAVARYFGVSTDYLLTGETQWGETPQRRVWIEKIESLSPDDQRRIQAVFDAMYDPNGKHDGGSQGHSSGGS